MARNNPTLNRVFALVEPVCNGAGYELVDLRLTLEQGGWVLRVCIDLLDSGAPLPADGTVAERRRIDTSDCERASREVSAVLDVEDPIPQAYSLEVSSPGIDRPLRTPAHFARFVGSEIKAVLLNPLVQDGLERRNFRGIIESVDAGKVKLRVDNKSYTLEIDDIDTARLLPDWDAVLRGDSTLSPKPNKPVDNRPGKSRKVASGKSRPAEAANKSGAGVKPGNSATPSKAGGSPDGSDGAGGAGDSGQRT
ncbi:MAG: ribosome maturation factor RimP [Kofleriaceae bacterium]|nr:ribosome maturation factor RimP [Kofleriaceae bacterium]